MLLCNVLLHANYPGKKTTFLMPLATSLALVYLQKTSFN